MIINEVPILNPTGRTNVQRGKLIPVKPDHLPEGAVGKSVTFSANATHYDEIVAWETLCVACRADGDFPARVLGFTDVTDGDARTITIYAV